MPEARVVVPLVIFFVMGALVVWLLWRIVAAGGKARRATASTEAASEIARRAEATLGNLLTVIDEVRRRKLPPEDALVDLALTQETLRRNALEASALSGGSRSSSLTAALVDDIERAARSVELVAHGVELLVDVSGVGQGEGETSVKRGYLNLVHAREAIRARREQIADGSDSVSGSW